MASFDSDIFDNAPKRNVNWTDRETEALLDLYKENLSSIRKNKRNRQVYEQISRILASYNIKRSTEEVRKKIQNINRRYREEKSKAEMTGEAPPWRFYKKIQGLITFQPGDESPMSTESLNCKIVEYGNDSFVQRCWEAEEHDSSNNEALNNSDQESNEEDSIQICLDTGSPIAETSASSTADHLELPSQHGNENRDDSPQLPRSFTASSNSKRSRNMGQEALIVNGDYNKKMRSNAERDECDVFAELIVKKLRRYNPVTRHIVQHHINTILFQADMGQYNDPSPYINNTSSAYCNQ